MSQILLIRITCPTRRVADRIADETVERRLAACANLDGPVTSTYRWKDVVEHSFEFVVWMKAPEANWDKIEALVTEMHPYDVPVLTGSPISHAAKGTAEWVDESTD